MPNYLATVAFESADDAAARAVVEALEEVPEATVVQCYSDRSVIVAPIDALRQEVAE